MEAIDPELEALAPLLKTKLEPVLPDQPFSVLNRHVAFADILDPRAAFLDGFVARKKYIPEHGFVVLAAELLDALAALLQGRRCLEVGAGNGLVSHFLTQRGVDIKASDLGGSAARGYGLRKVWQRDHEGDSLSLLPGDFDVIVMCWPPYQGNFAHQVVKAMRPGQLLVYEGESQGGCTADDAFFEALQDASCWERLNEESAQLAKYHLHFTTIHDRWSVWRKLA